VINTKWANILTEDMLTKKYLTENKSAYVIAKEIGCCQSQVYYRLHKFGIKVKTLSEAKVGKCYSKNYCCMDCGNLINRHTALYKQGRCVECNKKFRFGKNAPTYIDGRSSNCRCTECGKKVSYGHKSCQSCWQLGKLNPMYNNGVSLKINHCLDCGKEITYNSIRCNKCANGLLKVISKNYCCQKCGGLISQKTALYGHGIGLCKGCAYKVVKIFKNKYKNTWMRSSWESKFAKWCDGSNIEWEYEPKAFDLILNQRKRIYIPDFYLPEFDCWIEVKGWWRPKAKKKFNKFKKTYPEINIKVFDKKVLTEMGIICRR